MVEPLSRSEQIMTLLRKELEDRFQEDKSIVPFDIIYGIQLALSLQKVYPLHADVLKFTFERLQLDPIPDEFIHKLMRLIETPLDKDRIDLDNCRCEPARLEDGTINPNLLQPMIDAQKELEDRIDLGFQETLEDRMANEAARDEDDVAYLEDVDSQAHLDMMDDIRRRE